MRGGLARIANRRPTRPPHNAGCQTKVHQSLIKAIKLGTLTKHQSLDIPYSRCMRYCAPLTVDLSL